MKSIEDLQHLYTITGPTGRDYDLYTGHNTDVLEQLVAKSKEPEIMDRCPSDAAQRYKDIYTAFAWVSKGVMGRTVYPLLNPQSKELDGVVALGAKPFPQDDYASTIFGDALAAASRMSDTFAIRLYESAKVPELNRSGVSKEFTLRTIYHYFDKRIAGDLANPEVPFTGIYLEADADNHPALNAYSNFAQPEYGGFTTVGHRFDDGLGKLRTAMILPAENIGPMVNKI